MKSVFLRIAVLVTTYALGTLFSQAGAPQNFTLVGSRYPQETLSQDSIDCIVTVFSGPNVKAGTYQFDFGVPTGGHTLVVNSSGQFVPQTPSSGTISTNGYSITFDYIFYEVSEDWASNLTGSHLTYMDTRTYTFNLYPGSYGSTPIWSQQVNLNEYWYWDYEGGWQVGWNPDTWNVRPPLNSSAHYTISLPGAPPRPPDQSPPTLCPVCASCKAMAVYGFDQLRAGLMVNDTPVSYQPALGPGIAFTTTYNQRNVGQSSGPPVAGLGPLWTSSPLTYIIKEPTGSGSTVSRFVPGGGIEVYTGFQVTALTYNFTQTQFYGSFAPERNSHAILSWDPVNQVYTRTLPNGGSEIYSHKVMANGGTPYFLITSQTDPQGNVVTYSYDLQNRITAITDATGKQTTFSYGNDNPLLITQVTDPFGRSVKFTYDGSGRLQSATDPIGIVSVYGYDSTNFLNSLTTPYGTTTFSTDSDANHMGVQATNPLGQTERVELRYNSPSGISDTDTVPTASGLLATGSSGLSQNNTYYWDRRQYSSPLVYTQARITHWMTGPRGLTNMADSEKQPLEGRVWYTYQGQTVPDVVDDSTLSVATVTARILDDSTTQASHAGYNAQGLITQSIDPVGRTTNYTYAANGLDLTQVAQVNGSGQDVLGTMTYNSQHLPLTVVDASGQTTAMTYNSYGQLVTRTDAKGETTTLAYNSNHFLQSVTGPISGATTSYTYDSAGRVQTATDSEGYVLTMAYDNLDRPVSTTYPDSTTDLISYKWLDVAQTTDRQGRVTTNQYDAIRELLQTTDPLGRTTKYSWCTCGGLSTLTDANGNVTTWQRDLEGRVYPAKVYADGSQITYTYESTTSRLHEMEDAVGNTATYSYNLDNTLSGTVYDPVSGIGTTPNVSFAYDPAYNRVTSMTDGTGTTDYTYNAITGSTTTGAGRLGSVSVPIAGSTATVAYTYDQLGRVTARSVDGSTTNANNISTTFDALGRVTNVSNALGAFTYAYVDQTNRLSEVTYPNWQKTDYSYFGNTGDQRLQEIKNYVWGMISNTPLSKFDYTYNAVGTIATWTQQADSGTAVVNTLTYDNADQLTSAAQSGGGSAYNDYHYDPAGNRLAETTSSGTTAGQFNNLNQLKALGASASQTVAGNTSAAVSSVTVNAVPASISSSTNFTASVPLPTGTNVVSVVAQPTTGVTTTQRYQIVTTGTAATALTYDANGNTITDENGNTYLWDGLNRLTKITYASGATSNFAYDGLSRRISIIEKNSSGTVTSTKNYLWIGSEMAEERDGSNNVTKRFFPQGEQQIASGTATAYYYTRDHEGSVRELMSSTGTIVSRMAYDPYGRVTTVSGTTLPTKQYTGNYYHPTSGLNLTWRRAYDSNTGRWLSRDPITERGGINIYSYVSDDPVNGMDSSGLCGHFDINIGSISGTGGVNAVASDVPGYNLHFKDEGCCPNGKIKLVQALAFEGWLTHQAPSLDSTNADSKANATTPGGTPLPDASSSPGEIDDAPGSVPDWGATADLEVCAVCVCGGKEHVIGCVAFKWKNSNHMLNYQGKDVNSISADPVPPGSLYNAGVDDWHSRAGKGL